MWCLYGLSTSCTGRVENMANLHFSSFFSLKVNSLEGVECIEHHPGSGSVAITTSLTMTLLIIQLHSEPIFMKALLWWKMSAERSFILEVLGGDFGNSGVTVPPTSTLLFVIPIFRKKLISFFISFIFQHCTSRPIGRGSSRGLIKTLELSSQASRGCNANALEE